jgi:hypothetical protein
MPDTLIERVMGWAESHQYLVILDIQTGRSTMAAEMVPLMKYLARPYVHLALDPEFSIGTKKIPGKVIGRIDAADVNAVSSVLAQLVDSLKLPPKMLISSTDRTRHTCTIVPCSSRASRCSTRTTSRCSRPSRCCSWIRFRCSSCTSSVDPFELNAVQLSMRATASRVRAGRSEERRRSV